jgi:NADH-quinone oxidoreductase subunit M
MSHVPWLSILVWLPALGGVVALLLPRGRGAARRVSLGVVMLEFLAALAVLLAFRADATGLQFGEDARWIPALGAAYRVGVDPLSLVFVLLTAFLAVPRGNPGGFHAAVLFLESALMGIFLASDLLLFFVFWEAVLVPAFVLIGKFGSERRTYASVKFVLVAAAGSVPLLFAVLFWSARVGGAPAEMSWPHVNEHLHLAPVAQGALFLAFALAFAARIPLFPFHTWMPDAHGEAPGSASALLAGALLPAGAYGFLRFALPLCPDPAAWAGGHGALPALAAFGVLYAGLVALAQDDLVKAVAYSSLGRMGLAMLGILVLDPTGLAGALFTLVAHGLSAAALFLAAGMIRERFGSRDVADLGGLARRAPILSIFLAIAALSSFGFPGTAGFPGVLAVLAGAWRAAPWLAGVAALGVAASAAGTFWTLHRVLFREPGSRPADAPAPGAGPRAIRDASGRELAALLPLAAAILLLGLFPGPVFRAAEPAARRAMQSVPPPRQERGTGPRAILQAPGAARPLGGEVTRR